MILGMSGFRKDLALMPSLNHCWHLFAAFERLSDVPRRQVFAGVDRIWSPLVGRIVLGLHGAILVHPNRVLEWFCHRV